MYIFIKYLVPSNLLILNFVSLIRVWYSMSVEDGC